MAQGAGLENRSRSAPNHNSTNDLELSPGRALASCLAFFEREQPDLARIVRAWPTLPEPVKLAVLALVGTGGVSGVAPGDFQKGR